VNVFVTLGEDVGLNVPGLRANPFNVDFIQIVTLEDQRADDTLSRSSLHRDVDFTPEDIKLRLDSWRVSLLLDAHVHTIGLIADPLVEYNIELRSCSLGLGKVVAISRSESWIVLLASFQRVAV